MRVMITRPRLEAASLADALEALAVETLVEPLLHIDFIDGPAPDMNGVQALLVTSANGIRAFYASMGEAPFPPGDSDGLRPLRGRSLECSRPPLMFLGDSPPGSRPPPRSAGAPRGLNGPVAGDTPALAGSPEGQVGNSRALSLPVFTVGDASARAARELGFASVTSASGDVESLAGLVVERLRPEDGALAHVAATKVAGDLAGLLQAEGFEYRREILYRAHKAEAFSDAALRALAGGGLDGVLFFSPRTAKTFVNLAGTAGLEGAVERLDAYCLSDAVADEAAALAWRTLRIAARPEQSALLDLLKRN